MASEPTTEYEEVEITPRYWTVNGGPNREGRPVRFRGHLLGEYSTYYHDANSWDEYTAWKTQAGRFVVKCTHRNLWAGSRNSVVIKDYPHIAAMRLDRDGESTTPLSDAVMVMVERALGIDPAIVIK